MTQTPLGESTPDARTGEIDTLDITHPLSTFVRGTLRIHFNRGAVVERKASQLDARTFNQLQKDDRVNDALEWSTLHWFHWSSDQVVFSSFDAFRDQNWEIEPDERRKVEKAGHPDGVIASLVDHWRDRDQTAEPTYSIRAVATLHRFALEGLARETWDSMASALEGERGARTVASIVGNTREKNVRDAHEDKSAPNKTPEDALAVDDPDTVAPAPAPASATTPGAAPDSSTPEGDQDSGQGASAGRFDEESLGSDGPNTADDAGD